MARTLGWPPLRADGIGGFMVLNVSNTFKKSIDKRRMGTMRGISSEATEAHRRNFKEVGENIDKEEQDEFSTMTKTKE
jgi:hypothetical protein